MDTKNIGNNMDAFNGLGNSEKFLAEKTLNAFRQKFSFIGISLKKPERRPRCEILKELKSKSNVMLEDDIAVIEYEKRSTEFELIVKFDTRTVSRNYLEFIRQTSSKKKVMIITRHVSAELANLFRDADIFFIDSSANAYLKLDGLYLYSYDSSVKPEKQPEIIKRSQSAFYSSGLKLIFNFLNFPDLLNENYRRISDAAGISLGSIGWIVHRLKSDGYILNDRNDKKILMDKEEIWRKWIENYPEKLRRKLIKGRYRFLSYDSYKNWKKIELSYPMSLWGKESAAEIMTDYLKAKTLTIYTKENQLDLVKKLRLVPDENGDVEILEMFWEPDHIGKNDKTVPPLLVHADLMDSEDERNIETARLIYEKYISIKLK